MWSEEYSINNLMNRNLWTFPGISWDTKVKRLTEKQAWKIGLIRLACLTVSAGLVLCGSWVSERQWPATLILGSATPGWHLHAKIPFPLPGFRQRSHARADHTAEPWRIRERLFKEEHHAVEQPTDKHAHMYACRRTCRCTARQQHLNVAQESYVQEAQRQRFSVQPQPWLSFLSHAVVSNKPLHSWDKQHVLLSHTYNADKGKSVLGLWLLSI